MLKHDDCRRADQLRALAHPTRLAILRALAKRGTCLCGELVELTPLAQSTVSQHLKVLKEAGLVRGRIDGPRSCYGLDPDAIADLAAALADLFAELGAADGPLSLPAAATAANQPDPGPALTD
ncbi:ArsR/SmtB family transcription factor [Blastochloris viridis]|uniref:Arsenical resistance operon repressor n=1 Tax=Blastochloris viridis TaxID=1079 RepID=A0A0H5BG74_BLAVI|nr:metalloregulator ArsR/SmtB family transcription factor [Blastochloris viridis]ALK09966.1 Arsenical resistance operon repressor [Blastochloris viridis]BAS00120.1 arsenical resistance operon repressor [Blastochloris viridis]CUU42629.1 Arsenical resistance operon repressor [Blastochloris viridis]